MNQTIILRILILLLFGGSCLFPFIREMPSGGGVPGLSGLEAAIFVFPYFMLLLLSGINLTIVFFKKRGFPIIMTIISALFLVIFYYLTADWNYNLNESMSMYLLGPVVVLVTNTLVLILRNKEKVL